MVLSNYSFLRGYHLDYDHIFIIYVFLYLACFCRAPKLTMTSYCSAKLYILCRIGMTHAIRRNVVVIYFVTSDWWFVTV